MTNPFTPPGAESSDDPLCPWRHPDQKDWYVDVDSAEEEYSRFRDRIDIPGLTTRGRLVVIAGLEGCGKTSLLHRCAEYIDEHANRVLADSRPPGSLIVDLSQYVYAPVAKSDDPTIRRFCDVADEIAQRLKKIDAAPVDLDKISSLIGMQQPRLRPIYRELTRTVEQTRYTLIVLLPPISDFVNELREYSQIASDHARIVFLAESPTTKVAEFVDSERDSNRLIALKVKPLRGGDGWTFIEDRTIVRRQHPTTISPTQVQRAVEWLQSLPFPFTIGRLHQLCHRAWEPFAKNPSPHTLDAFDIVAEMRPYLELNTAGYGTGGDHQ